MPQLHYNVVGTLLGHLPCDQGCRCLGGPTQQLVGVPVTEKSRFIFYLFFHFSFSRAYLLILLDLPFVGSCVAQMVQKTSRTIRILAKSILLQFIYVVFPVWICPGGGDKWRIRYLVVFVEILCPFPLCVGRLMVTHETTDGPKDAGGRTDGRTDGRTGKINLLPGCRWLFPLPL